MEPRDVKEMTDREIAEETLELLRMFAKALESLGQSPYGQVMANMTGLKI
jgi:hypothetical protein